MHVHMHACIHDYIIYVFLCALVHIILFDQTIYIHTYTCTYTQVYIHTYTHMYVCVMSAHHFSVCNSGQIAICWKNTTYSRLGEPDSECTL